MWWTSWITPIPPSTQTVSDRSRTHRLITFSWWETYCVLSLFISLEKSAYNYTDEEALPGHMNKLGMIWDALESLSNINLLVTSQDFIQRGWGASKRVCMSVLSHTTIILLPSCSLPHNPVWNPDKYCSLSFLPSSLLAPSPLLSFLPSTFLAPSPLPSWLSVLLALSPPPSPPSGHHSGFVVSLDFLQPYKVQISSASHNHLKEHW